MAAGAGRQLVAFGQGRFGCIFEADDAEHVYKIELKVDTGWEYPENEIMEGIRQHYEEFPQQVTPNIVLTKTVEATLKSTDKSTFQVLWLPPQIRPAWITPEPMHFTVPKDLGDVGDGGCNLLLKHGISTVMFSIMAKYTGDCTKPPYKGDELIEDLAVEMNVALTTLERVGVIHRDIKPENIMWRMDADDDYEFALGDFGLATWTDRSDMEHVRKPGYTNDPVISGTPEFANREMLVQYEDMWVNDTEATDLERASSFASDRFALGATLLDIWANERMTDKPKGPPRPMLEGVTPYIECKPDNHEKWTWLTKTIDAWEDYFLSAALTVPHTFGMPRGTAMSADIKLCIGSLYVGEQKMLSATYDHYRSSGNAHTLGALVKYILDHIDSFEAVDAGDTDVLEYNEGYSPSGALYGTTALKWVQRPELPHVIERLIGYDGHMDDDDAEEEAAENEYNAAYEALLAFYSDHASHLNGRIESTKIGSKPRGGWNVSSTTSNLDFTPIDPRTQLINLRISELKTLLKERGQPTDGNKPALINRLNQAPDISAWYVKSSDLTEAERANVQEVTNRHNAWRAARNKIEAWNTIEVVLFNARSAGATEERIERLEKDQRDLTIEPLPGGYVPFSAIIAARLPPELKDEMAAKETAFATAAAAYIKTMEKDEAEDIEEDSQRKAEAENWRLDWEGDAVGELQRLGRDLNADPPYNDEVVETENQWYATRDKPKEIEILQRLLNEMKKVTVDEDLAAVLNQVRNLPDGMRPSNEWWQEVAVPFYRPVQPAEGTADAPIVLSDSDSDSNDVVAMEAVFTEARTTKTYYLVEQWISDYHAVVDAAWKAQQRALRAKLKQLYANHLFNHTDYFEVVGWEALRNYLKEHEGVTVLREGDAEYETLCSGADVERPPKCTLTFRQMVDELLTLHYTGHELPEYLDDEFGIGTLLDLFDEIDWNATAMNVDAYRKMALAIEHSDHTEYVEAVQTLWAPEELKRLGIDPADPDAEKVRAAFLSTYTDAESPEVLAFLEADAEFRRKYDINYDSTDLPLTLTEEELRHRTPMAENLLEEIVRFTYRKLTGVSLPPARHDTGAANGEMEVDLDGFTLGQLPSYTEPLFEDAQPYFRGNPSAAKDLLVAASRKYAKRLVATPVVSEALETLGVEKWDVLVKDKAWLCPGLDATVNKKRRLYVHAVARDADTTFVTFSGASTGRDPYDYLQNPNPTVEVSRPASGAEEAYVAYPLGEIARELDLAIPFDEDVESEEEDSDYDERDDEDPWDQRFQQLGRNPDPGFDYTDRTLQLENFAINDYAPTGMGYGPRACANERKLRRAYFEENAERGFPLRTGIVDRFVKKKARAEAIANAKYGPTGAVYNPAALAAKRAFPTHADGNDSDASETSSGIDTNSDYDSDSTTDNETMSEGDDDEILEADDPDEVLEDWGRKVRENYTPEILQLEEDWRNNGRPRNWQTTFEDVYSEFDGNAAAAAEFGRDELIEQIGNEISAEIDKKNERPIAYNVYLGRKEVYDVGNNTSLAASLNPIAQKPPWRCLTVPGVASYFTWTSTTDRSPMSDAWWRQGRAIARPIQSKGNIAIVDMHPDVFIRMVGELLAVDQPSRAQVNDMETVVEFICTLGVFECALLSRQAWLMTDELEPNSWTETRLKFITAFFEKVRRKFTLDGWLKYHSRLGYCGTPDARTFDPTVDAILFGQEFAAGGYQASAIDRYIFEVYPYRELVANCNLRLEVILNCRDKRPLDEAGGEPLAKKVAHYTDRVFI